MINSITLYPADKPRLALIHGRDGPRVELRSDANGFVVSMREWNEQDLVNLRDSLTQFITGLHSNPLNDFADEEARRQEQAAGSYAGCDSNHNQQ